MNILGISAYYHDSAAALVQDGDLVAAAQEERFTRKKHDPRFPKHAIAYCLREGGITVRDLDYVCFYEKPFLKFDRLLETYLGFVPQGYRSFVTAIPVWLRDKLWMRDDIRKMLDYEGDVLFTEHHESHAASAFYPSPFREAAFLTMDGVGEWATSSYGVGRGNALEMMGELKFPHSLGLLYSAFTSYAGFKVNSGEYKVMGLAPYGEPRYVDVILRELVDLKEDGSVWLNMEYFNYCQGLTMTNGKFDRLLGGPARRPESRLTQREMDLARSIQDVTEEAMLRMTRHVHRETKQQALCLAGGVALNCVGNGRILREGPFDHIWIQPAAGDAGGAVGAALAVWHRFLEHGRLDPSSRTDGYLDGMKGAFLGPAFTPAEIRGFLDDRAIPFREVPRHALPQEVARLLANEQVVGWLQGRMEFGPRALGGRSILADARSTRMQSQLNLKIKFRESFRPFAPSVLRENVSEWFEVDCESPYMLLVAPVREELCFPMTAEQKSLFGIEKLNVPRSTIPAVTHVDYSARIQTVTERENPAYYALLKAFRDETGCAVLVNTSFNVRGEPIVCTPADAYRCFMRTEMDYLVLENFILDKREQPAVENDDSWMQEFQLD
ncbi:MAG: carbamoyltransferase [Acidobacteria bacterium]|nr:carbamoyltransferase [Acidobacteriota bacterium]